MAFNVHSLHLILNLAKKEGWEAPISIICMGYPDMLIDPDVLGKEFGITADPVIREDSEAVLAWHGICSEGRARVVESTWLLKYLGLDPYYADIHAARGDEVIINMNEPLPAQLRGQFKIVYDAGGLEHYFNVAQGVRNILDLCEVGGVIYHGNPHVAHNHGFYNFCPTFYYDFYHQNGHQLLGGPIILKNGVPAGTVDWIGRYRLAPMGDTWIQVLVKKMHAKDPKWPIQTKYINNPSLQGRLN